MNEYIINVTLMSGETHPILINGESTLSDIKDKFINDECTSIPFMKRFNNIIYGR